MILFDIYRKKEKEKKSAKNREKTKEVFLLQSFASNLIDLFGENWNKVFVLFYREIKK